MLDDRAERTLSQISGELSDAFGSRLVALALYGSGAGAGYVPGASDLNLVAVLDEIDHQALAIVRPRVARWRKRGVATPLLLDRRFLATAVDVFPVEMHEIRSTHRMLFGTDVFADLEISDHHLRYQCEHEARGKLLRLRELYMEIGDQRKALRHLMLDSLKTFLVVVRTLSRMRGQPEAATDGELLATFAESFQCSLPTFARLLDIRLSCRKWEGDEEALFRSYLNDVGTLVDVIDRLPPAESDAHRPNGRK